MTKSSERYRIEAITSRHDRAAFDCGHPFLNAYLARFARQNDRKGLARAFVLVPQPDSNPVLGYYTLMSGAVAFEHLPQTLRQGLPKYPIPVARIGELAVDQRQKGKGFGSDLLLDAITRIVRASRQVAVWAIIVDPIDPPAATFYQHHGFQALPDSEALILTMQDAMAWLKHRI
ncbi:MAG: GNAT family N-acetyltransferase [Lamprobacter sp.]|uniref:GNAT family N-acetyltransferase n=1 Tax=Lamprobacter sp. TaxID=3100796 RepID=UPI002B257176|nr:GNAT family N-acetyltransferase [Lamprobacter sp.]MEA3640072.1 GNAT family N-acetyltransferase [Lamprobacter sp.]